MLGVLAFIFALGLIILIHEGGHFIFARRVNVLCREYAFGMGPQILKKKKGETTYSLRLLPIGGFCAIAGEEEEADPLKDLKTVRLEIEDGVVTKFYVDPKNIYFNEKKEYIHIAHDLYDEKQTGNLFITVKETVDGPEITYPVDPKAMYVLAKEEIQIAPYNRCLASKRKRDRAMIMFAGPMMNFVLALIVFFFAGLINGYVDYDSNTVAMVSQGSAVYNDEVAMQAGDVIYELSVDGHKYDISDWKGIENFMTMYQTTETYSDNHITISYRRGEQENTITVTPELTAYLLGGVGFSYRDDGKVMFTFVHLNDDEKAEYEDAYYAEFGETAMPIGCVVNKVNGIEITSLQTLNNFFNNHGDGSDITFTIQGGLEFTFKPYTEKLMKTQKSSTGEQIPMSKITLGITPEYEKSFFKSFGYSLRRTGQSATIIIDTLALLFSGKVGIKNLGGVVSIFAYTSNAAKQGFATLLNWIGLLSVNIGIMNLLPIPALDGGRLVFVAYEAITKKKPSPKVETILITVTMILLLGFMAFITVMDILKFI